MRWGRVEVHPGFLLMIAWLNYLETQGMVPVALLACACHELGHYAALKVLGNDIQLLRLNAVGAEMLPQKPMGYGQEILTVAAGPAASLLLAVMFCHWEWGGLFAGLNLVLGCFNLLPVSRLDGGRVLKCLLSLAAGPHISALICAYLDLCITLALLLLGLILVLTARNLTLLTVSLWLVLSYFNGKERKKGLPD